MQRTFVMVKPDGVGRGLTGTVIARLERRGLRLVGMKLLQIPPELAAKHYAAHQAKPFYPGLIRFITSGPVVAMVWEGDDAISQVRTMMGPTDPGKAPPGTIRGDFALTIDCNVIHGSDGPDAAASEIALYFSAAELVSVPRPEESWIYPQTSR